MNVKLFTHKLNKMKEVKRTYQFEHEYTHGLTGYPATVTCEVDIDYARKQWAINNLTAHLFTGSGWSSNLPKIKATLEMHLKVIDFAMSELDDNQ
jgi:hypothetical protein